MNALKNILYQGVIFLFSLVPFWLVYLKSGFLKFILKNIIGYRKNVATKNFNRVFPHKTENEIKSLVNQSYIHLSDIFLEGIKNQRISRKHLEDRLVLHNKELFEQMYQNGKSILLLSSHHNNWEYLITAQNFLLPHQAVGIGKPLSKKNLDIQVNKNRERFGMHVVHAYNYKEVIEEYINKKDPIAILVLADQSPSVRNAYWTKFFNIETPFSFGVEMLAHTYDMPVIYLKTLKTNRGFYEIYPEVITEGPSNLKHGEILDRYSELLKQQILEQPANWLWTHRRWKHDPPKNLDEVKAKHKQEFEKRFQLT